MSLPEEINTLTEQFNREFPPYAAEVKQLMAEHHSRRTLFSERFLQARRQFMGVEATAGNNVAAYELRSSSEFNDEWLNRYTFSRNRMIDKLNAMFSKMLKASTDPIYAQSLWAALKLDNLVEKERCYLDSITEFKESLKELTFTEVQHKEAQLDAITSMDMVIQQIEYAVVCLMRTKIALWNEQDPTMEGVPYR